MQAESVGRWSLRIAGLAGFALFAFVFVLTYRTPEWVETFARDYVEQQVRDRIEARISALAPAPAEGALGELARELYELNAGRIEQLKSQLENRANDLFRVALDQVRELDCECRARIEQWWTDMNAVQLAILVTDNQRILRIIQDGYMGVVEELRAEIRIFASTNAACFLLLLLVSFVKPAASRHLLFPGALLLVATSFCIGMYLFEQNWLLTIIHGDYLGWACAAWLGVAFLLLCDVALNRARLTCRLVNSAIESLGGAVVALTPC